MNQVLADATTQLHSLSQLVSSSASGAGMMNQVLADATTQLLSRSSRHEEALASLDSLVREQSRQIQVLGDVLASHGQTLGILNSVRPMQRLKRLFGRK
jgi:hypothetical protein